MAQAKQDMGSGSVKKLMLQLMIPAVVAQVVNLLYNIVDRIYIGHIEGIGAAALTSLQQFNFTKAFLGANGVALGAGFTTPDPEEAAVKAMASRRARETWFLVDDSKFGRVYPAVISELYGGAILTNRCPEPKYKQLTLVKETEL